MPRQPNHVIARQWRQNVMLDVEWVESPSSALMTRGRCEGLTCTYPSFQRNAYVKPFQAGDRFPGSAAREKIASDLAFDLGINVPPVVLAPRVRGQDPDCLACASLVLHDRQLQWRVLRRGGVECKKVLRAITTFPAVVSRLLVFNTFVGQHDHQDGDPQGNLVVGYELDPTHYQVVSAELIPLDYEGALPTGSGAEIARVPPSFPSEWASRLDGEAIVEMAARIAAYPDETISHLVNRLPEAYLPQAEGERLAEVLIGRRDTLVSEIETRFKGIVR